MDRFSTETEQTLRRAGWYPGRHVPEVVSSLKDNETLSGFEMFPAAEEVLSEFGGLKVDQQGPGETGAREPFQFDPALAGYEEEFFSDFSRLVNTKLYPLGEAANGHSYWAIGENGNVYLVMFEIGLLGKNIEEALDNLIIGRNPSRILSVNE